MLQKPKIDLTKVSFRKMSGYYEAAASIDRESGNHSWDVKDFWSHCRKENCSGVICLLNTTPVAFLAYEFIEDEIHIHNLGLRSQFTGSGLGSKIFDHMKKKLRDGKRTLKLVVRETNLKMQLFLKKRGFLAIGVARNYFIDYYPNDVKREDGYCFEFRHSSSSKNTTGTEVPVGL